MAKNTSMLAVIKTTMTLLIMILTKNLDMLFVTKYLLGKILSLPISHTSSFPCFRIYAAASMLAVAAGSSGSNEKHDLSKSSKLLSNVSLRNKTYSA